MQQATGIWNLCLRKTQAEKPRDYRDIIVLEKLRFQNVFRPHENKKPVFSNSSGLKNVFEKLCFRDGLVWTVRLTVEIKLCCQIPSNWGAFSESSVFETDQCGRYA